jgi:hypothetical protein
VQFLEKGLGSDTPTRKQNESLIEQLKMVTLLCQPFLAQMLIDIFVHFRFCIVKAKEREEKLRQDLQSERQERIILERKCNEVLARLAHSFSSEPLKPLNSTSSASASV